MPASARRVIGAVVAATGVILAVVGAWVVVMLGPSGEASFTATSKAPGGAVVVTPDVLDAVDVPVQVKAQRRDGGSVLVAVAPSTDASAVLAKSAVSTVKAVRYPAEKLDLQVSGAGTLGDISTADVWRLADRGTGTAAMVVDQGHGPQTVVVASGDTSALSDVTVTLTWANHVWFFEALAVATLGAVIAAFAINDLWQSRVLFVSRDAAETPTSEATT